MKPPRDPAEHEGRVVAQHPGEDGSHRRQSVDDRHLRVRVFVLELAGQGAGGQVVALPDVGRDDEDLARARLGVGLARRDDRLALLGRDPSGLLATPAHVTAHALAEGGRGRPAQFGAGALAGDDLRAQVPGPGRGVDDLRVTDDLLDELGDLLDGDVLVTDEVVDAVGGHVAEPERDAVGEVLDVDEAPGLHTVAGQGERLTPERLVDEGGDDRRLPGPGPVGDPEAQNRVVDPVQLLIALAVELAGQLGARVEVAGGREQGLLVDLVGLGVAVDPDRRGVDDALHAGPPSGLEHGHRAAGIDPLGILGLGVDVVDVGDRGQVRHGVAAVQRPFQRLAIGDRAEHRVDGSGLVPARRPQVVDHRFVTARAQLVHHVGADEARTACDEDAHAFP